MKKQLLVIILFLILFFASVTNIAAQNKAGINIGANHDDMDKAAQIVGPGGWAVMMACPSDGDKIAEFISSHPNINLIIRGHFFGQTPDTNLAKLWAATLASIPFPNKIYFIPWNEPNQQGLSDYGTPAQVVQYTNALKSELNKYGILGNKVGLLSPMLNQTYNASCEPNSNSQFLNYVAQLGGGSFFSQFEGIAMNLYDNETCGSPLCCGNPNFNASRFQEVLVQMGVPGAKVFAVESGVLKNGVEYKDADLNNFYRAVFPSWNSQGNFVMFALFSYDPEHEEDWNIFSVGNLTANYFKSIAQSGSPQKITPSSLPVLLNKCPGKNFSFYLNSESECTSCGGGGSFTLNACSPIVGDNFGEEYARESIPITEKIRTCPGDSECIEKTFTAKAEVSDLQIPFTKDLNRYFLGPLVDNLKALPLNARDQIKNAGVFQRIAPKDLQDKLKLEFLQEISSRASSRYQNFKINGLGPGQISNRFNSIAEKQKKGEQLTQSDKNFLIAVWPRVPLFANEETEGEIAFEGSGVNNISKVKTSVPEVYRLNRVTTLLWQMLNPQSTQGLAQGQQAQRPQVLSACAETPKIDPNTSKKEGKGGPGDNVCTKEEIQPSEIKESNLQVDRSFTKPPFQGSSDVCPEQNDELTCEDNYLWLCTTSTGENGHQACHKVGFCKHCAGAGPCCSWEEGSRCGECVPVNVPIVVPPNPSKVSCIDKNYTVDLNIKNRVPFLAQIAEKTVGPNGFFKIFTPAYKEQGQLTAVEQQIKREYREVAGESKAKIEFKNIRASGMTVEIPPSNMITLLFHKLGTIFNVKEFISKQVLSPFGRTYPKDWPPPNPNVENLSGLLGQIGNESGVPEKILEAVLQIEGPQTFDLTKDEAQKYSQSGAVLPNCGPNECSAIGPMQITTGTDNSGSNLCQKCACYPTYCPVCPNAWLKNNCSGNPCNLKDNISCAAKKLKSDSGGSGSTNWTQEQVYQAAESYYGECETKFERLGNKTYCEFVWDYYNK